nr:hypothetical protein [Planctomycetota bacterium]
IEDGSKLPPAIGVRFLPDNSYTIPNPSDPTQSLVRAFGSMVFVQENDPLPTFLTVFQEEVSPGQFEWRASQFSDLDGPGGDPEVSFGQSSNEFALRAAGELMKRGLLPGRLEGGVPTFYLPVYFDRDASQEPYYVRFTPANLARDDGSNPPVFYDMSQPYGGGTPSTVWWLHQGELSKPYFDATSSSYAPQPCKFRVLPSVVPSEEPRILPRGAVIDVASSVIGGSTGGSSIQGQLRADGSFDVMFNSRGIVDGPLASRGQVHLVVVDGEDIERGFSIFNAFADADGTPGFDDADGDGAGDERQGDEYIISVRTQTGSVYVSDVNNVVPDTATGIRPDPFAYAETGGEAR